MREQEPSPSNSQPWYGQTMQLSSGVSQPPASEPPRCTHRSDRQETSPLRLRHSTKCWPRHCIFSGLLVTAWLNSTAYQRFLSMGGVSS